MSDLNSILAQVGGHAGVAGVAAKLGLDQRMVEKAIAALGAAHPQPGNTLESASAKTGLDTGVLAQIVQQIGGEGSLDRVPAMIGKNPAAIAGLFDRDGDGNPLNDIAGMARGLFGKS